MARENIKILSSHYQIRGWGREMIHHAKTAIANRESFTNSAITLGGMEIIISGIYDMERQDSIIWMELGKYIFLDNTKNLYDILDLVYRDHLSLDSYAVQQYTVNYQIIVDGLRELRETGNNDQGGNTHESLYCKDSSSQ